MGIFNKIQREFLAQPVQVALGPFSEKHSFLLCNSAPSNLFSKNPLSKRKGLICFVSNGDTLEFSDKTESDLSCSSLSVHDTEEEEFGDFLSRLSG